MRNKYQENVFCGIDYFRYNVYYWTYWKFFEVPVVEFLVFDYVHGRAPKN